MYKQQWGRPPRGLEEGGRPHRLWPPPPPWGLGRPRGLGGPPARPWATAAAAVGPEGGGEREGDGLGGDKNWEEEKEE